jgi:hypothetical protein
MNVLGAIDFPTGAGVIPALRRARRAGYDQLTVPGSVVDKLLVEIDATVEQAKRQAITDAEAEITASVVPEVTKVAMEAAAELRAEAIEKLELVNSVAVSAGASIDHALRLLETVRNELILTGIAVFGLGVTAGMVLS